MVVGPTAVGKTGLGIELALHLKGEVISGDSMQVYKLLDIGTAKIRPEETRGVPHHLLDIREPDEAFSVADFQQLAREKISEISQRGKLPILVGGTGLYVQAVLDQYEFGPQDEDNSYRLELQSLATEKGNSFVHQKLQVIDPLAAERLHPNDLRRIIRALEYHRTTGLQISTNTAAAGTVGQERYQAILIGLTMDRQILYRRIEERVDQMMEEGFLEEVESILARGYRPELQALQGLGYKQLVSYLQGEVSLKVAIELIKRDTRHFAKRQLTWFRRDPRIEWFNVDNYLDRGALLREILSFIGRSINSSVE